MFSKAIQANSLVTVVIYTHGVRKVITCVNNYKPNTYV